jgi:hypothetical protein
VASEVRGSKIEGKERKDKDDHKVEVPEMRQP